MDECFMEAVLDAQLAEDDGFIIDPREVLKEAKKFGMPSTLIDDNEIMNLARKVLQLYT
jgi:hypothetical protein